MGDVNVVVAMSRETIRHLCHEASPSYSVGWDSRRRCCVRTGQFNRLSFSIDYPSRHFRVTASFSPLSYSVGCRLGQYEGDPIEDQHFSSSACTVKNSICIEFGSLLRSDDMTIIGGSQSPSPFRKYIGCFDQRPAAIHPYMMLFILHFRADGCIRKVNYS